MKCTNAGVWTLENWLLRDMGSILLYILEIPRVVRAAALRLRAEVLTVRITLQDGEVKRASAGRQL